MVSKHNITIIAAIIICGAFAVPAGGSGFPGPRLASVELISTKGSERPEKASAPFTALTTFDLSGSPPRHLLKARLEEGAGLAPLPFRAPTWSPDGSTIAFFGSKGKVGGIYVIGADGTDPRLVLRRRGLIFNAVFGPDGTTIAFSVWRFRSVGHSGFFDGTTTWLLNTQTGATRRLTRWEDGLSNVPSSFSPDGSVLAVTRTEPNGRGPRVALLRLDGSGVTDLGQFGEEPAISPDGSKIAFVGYRDATHVEAEEAQEYDIGELYTMNLDGSHVQRLTRNKTGIESSPSWDPSGQRLAYVQTRASTSFDPTLDLLFPTGNSIREMNADGSCRKTVRSDPQVAFYGVGWQPGPEHEATRLTC